MVMIKSLEEQNMETLLSGFKLKNSIKNKLYDNDRKFHDWFRFVLSFPPHLVRKYIKEFNLTGDDLLLDPFCGTGTTLVESKLLNVPSIGIEANPIAYFASETKVDWDVDATLLLETAQQIKNAAMKTFKDQGISDFPVVKNLSFKKLKKLNAEQEKMILKNSISPLPLHKCLILLEFINNYKNTKSYKYLSLALANTLVSKISNLRFGPEVGVGKIKEDVNVISPWFQNVLKITNDIKSLRGGKYAQAQVRLADSRYLSNILKSNKISAVITSPPYPNEKDYTRTTRLESVVLGFINAKDDLRRLKKSLIRSNTRGVYKEDNDDVYVKNFPEIQNVSHLIEKRRIELGKTSGFERLYPRVTELYFGGMAKHLLDLKNILRPNSYLAYVVGDQASYLRVMIKTGQIIGEIAKSLGYKLIRIDLFRTRFSTATKSNLNEEVVILRWPGDN